MTKAQAEPVRVVCKYGGTSLATLAKIANVAKAVAQRVHQGEQVVVVCSAMGASTDTLLQQAHALHGRPPPRELDMLVTCGERTSVALLAIALDALGVPALSLTGSQAGIVTNEDHQASKILAVRPHRILTGLAAGKVVVVAGYQGVSRTGEVTTLGRGGSDATAVALGAALAAACVVLYSDVDGVYSADPRQLAAAQWLPNLDYATMHTLAIGGAKVVYAEAVRLAEALGVVLLARTAHPSVRGLSGENLPPRQTRIADGLESQGAGLGFAVAVRAQVVLADAPQLLDWQALAGPLTQSFELLAAANATWIWAAATPAQHAALHTCLRAHLEAKRLVRVQEAALLTAAGPRIAQLGVDAVVAAFARANLALWALVAGPRLLQVAVARADADAALAALHALGSDPFRLQRID